MQSPPEFGNNLFPVFVKLEQLHILVVGGMYIGEEKLSSVLVNSPNTRVTLVAMEIGQQVRDLADEYPNVTLVEKAFDPSDLDGVNLVIVGINDIAEGEKIQAVCKQRNILINVADKPSLCDFYLGSVVKKGDLKIAISTNGKSPTVAKRIKEFLNESIPETIDDILQNMTKIREQLRGDFEEKIKALDDVTSVWGKTKK